jgi:hypothetical protein
MAERIEGGYILLARKILDSEIMEKPPLCLKLWVWMLEKANHKDRGKFKRGQFHTSIREMQEAMAYKVGYRKNRPTVKQIRRTYEGLMKGTMISTAKGTRGMVVTILNYDRYQNPKNYEGHSKQHHEGLAKGSVGAHYKQELKNISTIAHSEDGLTERFDTFWMAYPKKKSKGQARKTWMKIKPSEQLLTEMLGAMEGAKTSVEWNKDNGKFIPYPSTWLNAEGWNDEFEEKPAGEWERLQEL